MMPRNPQVAHAEAISELERRAVAAGFAEPAALAHDFVRWMVREGWRPSSARIETSTDTGQVCPPDAAPDYQAAKAALRGGHGA